MKKKLTVLAVLFLSIAISAYSVAGTYAKYTTSSDTVTSKARVAKWGLSFEDSVDDTVNIFAHSDANVVDNDADGTYVIAPGTSNNETILTITPAASAPEVSYKVEFNIDLVDENGDKLTSMDANTTSLMSKLLFSTDGTNYDTFASIKAELENDINDTYDAGQNISAKTVKLYWQWAFDDDGDDTFDASDTALGNAAFEGNIDPIYVAYSISATQID